MGAKIRNKKRKSISLAHQEAALLAAYSESSAKISGGYLVWSGKVRPAPLSQMYNLQVEYDGKRNPKTYVVGDELRKLDDPDLPHKYSVDIKDKRIELCLFMPGENEWHSSKLISLTIIPWAIEWLYFYEIWLATGEWCGGGFHHDMQEKQGRL